MLTRRPHQLIRLLYFSLGQLGFRAGETFLLSPNNGNAEATEFGRKKLKNS